MLLKYVSVLLLTPLSKFISKSGCVGLVLLHSKCLGIWAYIFLLFKVQVAKDIKVDFYQVKIV